VRGRLEDPETAVRFLGEEYRKVLRSIGVLFDESTYVTTVDDDYRSFIRWQFARLKEAGALGQGAYYSSVCPVDGAVAVDPSETDLSSGGDAEVVKFTTVPFRLDDGRILLAATLRPETVYGVTNIWLPPDGTLKVWHHRERVYLASPAGVERLVDQHGGHAGQSVATTELIDREVEVPLLGGRVPIFAGAFVDPSIGTGVVMSVPAHAPADAAALGRLEPTARARAPPPRILLEIPEQSALTVSERELVEGSGTPAERALQAVSARSAVDPASVETATDRLYRLEYVRGRMTIPELSGVMVRDARERVAAQLESAGDSFPLQEFSKPVICRNGHAVVIRRVPDQWFLRYGDPAWKAEVDPLISRLFTWPAEYGRELRGILDWFQDRPCTRRGRWLGTPFPFDPGWVIEPIADSTFYMAYFIVRRFVATGRVDPAHLSEAFFDLVFLGRGDGDPRIDRAVQRELRDEFLYWYPLDLNIGGKEHKRVHFPVFLYTHAKLLPPALQPRGIYVHGWVTGPAGAKISKKEVSSKGGRIPTVARALETWGADALRLGYALAASPAQDIEWDPAFVDAAVERLREVERLVREATRPGSSAPELDAWLAASVHAIVRGVRAAFDAADVRSAAELVYVRFSSVLRRYYLRGGVPGPATEEVARAWIRLLSPITPHLAEELGEGRFDTLVALAGFPEPAEFAESPVAEAREAFLDRAEEDLRAVLKPIIDRGETAPDEVIFYIASEWKRLVEGWMRESIDLGEAPSVKEVMARASGHPELAAYRPEIAKYVQRVGPLLRSEAPIDPTPIDEGAVLRAAEAYLSRRLGFQQVSVVAEANAEPRDPLGRRDRARPGRPAFYFVRPGRR